jgi:hypothetical protein
VGVEKAPKFGCIAERSKFIIAPGQLALAASSYAPAIRRKGASNMTTKKPKTAAQVQKEIDDLIKQITKLEKRIKETDDPELKSRLKKIVDGLEDILKGLGKVLDGLLDIVKGIGKIFSQLPF